MRGLFYREVFIYFLVVMIAPSKRFSFALRGKKLPDPRKAGRDSFGAREAGDRTAGGDNPR